MQEIFVCCAAADRAAAEPILAALAQLDALNTTLELCDSGELPEACAAASDAAGVVLLLSPESVPQQSARALWGPVLDRIENMPATVASVQLAPCSFPSMLKTRALFVGTNVVAEPLIRHWAIALDSRERFEVVGFDDQHEYRDVLWIPCANRERETVHEDLREALDGRRVLIVLDRCPPDLAVPTTTRERIVRHHPADSPALEPLPAAVAACYPDFLDRDFCARLAGIEPAAIAALLEPISRDRRILRVPLEARNRFDPANTPRRRHAELLNQYLSARNAQDHIRLIRLELPAALEYALATDWNFGASLGWRAREILKDRYPGETGRLLLRLRQSAINNKVRSWVDLCEQELRWMDVEIPTGSPAKGKSDSRQLSLEW